MQSNIQIVEYNEKRVLTTDQLAQAYECEPNNIKKNFNSNKERFEEGKHYFKIEGAELQNLRVTFSDLQISPMTRTLYLWTRRGASRHCKMIGTDRAWEMFDMLEENYFVKQNNNPALPDFNNPVIAARAWADAMEKRQIAESKVEEMQPKALFADAVSSSHTSILIRDLAKLIKQNGVDIGQNRLYAWLREKGYLIKSGSDKNMPTQKSMDMKLFEVKEGNYIDGSGRNCITRTTKVTGKGQVYFVNKLLAGKE